MYSRCRLQEYINVQRWSSYLLDQPQTDLRQETNVQPKGATCDSGHYCAREKTAPLKK